MKLKFYLLTLCFSCIGLSWAQSLYTDVALEYGPHSVGFRHEMELDRSRAYERTMDFPDQLTFRQMPVSMWYPLSVTASANPVSIADYLRILKEEEEWESLPDEYIFSWFYYPETEAGKENTSKVTHAYRNGQHRDGQHPVVIYSPSYNASSVENFMLCEYLASKGYVVLSTPSRGSSSFRLEGGITRDAETQRRDLEFLVGYASTLPFVDLDRLFTIGFSFGGLSNVLFAMNNPHVDGVISLDGTIKYHPEVAQASPFYRPENFSIPFLHISQRDIPAAVMEADKIDPELGKNFTFFDSLNQAPAYHYQHTSLTHSCFSSFGVLFEPRDPRQDRPNAVINAGYADMCKLTAFTLAEMDAYRSLQHSWDHSGFADFAEADGLKLREVSMAHTKAFGFKDFFAQIKEAAFEDLPGLYEATRKEYPGFQVKENDLNTVGLQLVFAPSSREAGLDVFKFALTLYPESANLHDSIAEAYLHARMMDQAKQHFERSLALYPGNTNAVKRLKEFW